MFKKLIYLFIIAISLNFCLSGCNSDDMDSSFVNNKDNTSYTSVDIEDIFIPYERLSVMSYRSYFDNDNHTLKNGKQKNYNGSLYTVFENKNSYLALNVQKETNVIIDFIYLSKNYRELTKELFEDCKTFDDVKTIDDSCVLINKYSELYSEIILSDGSVLKIIYKNNNGEYIIIDTEIVLKNYIKSSDLNYLIS